MKKNIGTLDRILRVLIAIVITVLYLNHTITGTLGIVLIILSGIFIITSLIQICPLYLPFGLNSIRKKR